MRVSLLLLLLALAAVACSPVAARWVEDPTDSDATPAPAQIVAVELPSGQVIAVPQAKADALEASGAAEEIPASSPQAQTAIQAEQTTNTADELAVRLDTGDVVVVPADAAGELDRTSDATVLDDAAQDSAKAVVQQEIATAVAVDAPSPDTPTAVQLPSGDVIAVPLATADKLAAANEATILPADNPDAKDAIADEVQTPDNEEIAVTLASGDNITVPPETAHALASTNEAELVPQADQADVKAEVKADVQAAVTQQNEDVAAQTVAVELPTGQLVALPEAQASEMVEAGTAQTVDQTGPEAKAAVFTAQATSTDDQVAVTLSTGETVVVPPTTADQLAATADAIVVPDEQQDAAKTEVTTAYSGDATTTEEPSSGSPAAASSSSSTAVVPESKEEEQAQADQAALADPNATNIVRFVLTLPGTELPGGSAAAFEEVVRSEVAAAVETEEARVDVTVYTSEEEFNLSAAARLSSFKALKAKIAVAKAASVKLAKVASVKVPAKATAFAQRVKNSKKQEKKNKKNKKDKKSKKSSKKSADADADADAPSAGARRLLQEEPAPEATIDAFIIVEFLDSADGSGPSSVELAQKLMAILTAPAVEEAQATETKTEAAAAQEVTVADGSSDVIKSDVDTSTVEITTPAEEAKTVPVELQTGDVVLVNEATAERLETNSGATILSADADGKNAADRPAEGATVFEEPQQATTSDLAADANTAANVPASAAAADAETTAAAIAAEPVAIEVGGATVVVSQSEATTLLQDTDAKLAPTYAQPEVTIQTTEGETLTVPATEAMKLEQQEGATPVSTPETDAAAATPSETVVLKSGDAVVVDQEQADKLIADGEAKQAPLAEQPKAAVELKDGTIEVVSQAAAAQLEETGGATPAAPEFQPTADIPAEEDVAVKINNGETVLVSPAEAQTITSSGEGTIAPENLQPTGQDPTVEVAVELPNGQVEILPQNEANQIVSTTDAILAPSTEQPSVAVTTPEGQTEIVPATSVADILADGGEVAPASSQPAPVVIEQDAVVLPSGAIEVVPASQVNDLLNNGAVLAPSADQPKETVQEPNGAIVTLPAPDAQAEEAKEPLAQVLPVAAEPIAQVRDEAADAAAQQPEPQVLVTTVDGNVVSEPVSVAATDDSTPLPAIQQPDVTLALPNGDLETVAASQVASIEENQGAVVAPLTEQTTQVQVITPSGQIETLPESQAVALEARNSVETPAVTEPTTVVQLPNGELEAVPTSDLSQVEANSGATPVDVQTAIPILNLAAPDADTTTTPVEVVVITDSGLAQQIPIDQVQDAIDNGATVAPASQQPEVAITNDAGQTQIVPASEVSTLLDNGATIAPAAAQPRDEEIILASGDVQVIPVVTATQDSQEDVVVANADDAQSAPVTTPSEPIAVVEPNGNVVELPAAVAATEISEGNVKIAPREDQPASTNGQKIDIDGTVKVTVTNSDGSSSEHTELIQTEVNLGQNGRAARTQVLAAADAANHAKLAAAGSAVSMTTAILAAVFGVVALVVAVLIVRNRQAKADYLPL